MVAKPTTSYKTHTAHAPKQVNQLQDKRASRSKPAWSNKVKAPKPTAKFGKRNWPKFKKAHKNPTKKRAKSLGVKKIKAVPLRLRALLRWVQATPGLRTRFQPQLFPLRKPDSRAAGNFKARCHFYRLKKRKRSFGQLYRSQVFLSRKGTARISRLVRSIAKRKPTQAPQQVSAKWGCEPIWVLIVATTVVAAFLGVRYGFSSSTPAPELLVTQDISAPREILLYHIDPATGHFVEGPPPLPEWRGFFHWMSTKHAAEEEIYYRMRVSNRKNRP